MPGSRARASVVAASIAALLVAVLPATALAAGPVAADDHVSVPVGAPATPVTVLANDTGTALSVVSTTDPSNGTVVIAGDGLSVTYQPDTAFHGTDTFDYTITDGDTTDDGTVTVDVNSPPVAVDDPGTACQPAGSFGGAYPVVEDYIAPAPPAGTFVWFGDCALLANDTDPDGDDLTWEIVSQPSHGDAVKIDEEFFGYKPDPDYSASDHGIPATDFDSFTYRAYDGFAYSAPATMRVWVAPLNDAPSFSAGNSVVVVGEDSGAYSAPWATSISPGPASESWQTVTFDVDTPPNGVPNLFAAPPAIASDGTLTFIPNPDEVGLVHVTVRATDDGGVEDWDQTGQTQPRDTSDPVTFDIVVMPDAVTAVDDEATLPEDPDPGPWLIDVLGNDTFDEGATVASVTQGTLGLVTIAPDGLSVLYQPDPDANGADSFTYTLDDGEGSADTATVDVTVTPVNDDPVADDDEATVKVDGPATAIDVLGNDGDVDGDTLLITGTSAATKGTVAITGGGTGLTYHPATGAIGADSFTYTIGDGTGRFDTASVDIAIATNVPPVAGDDLLTVAEDASATAVEVLADDSDSDGDTLQVTATSTPTKGTVVITGGGTSLTYEPDPDANGSDSFTYTVSDGQGGTDTATVDVTITPQPDDPVAATDTVTVAEDAAATSVPVLANDSDPDGDPRTITAKTDGAKGVVVITGGGTGLTYKPNLNANGSDSFTYTIGDGTGRSDTGTVNVTITQVNDKPDALNDAGLAAEQGSGARPLAVLGNDSDPDGDTLLITGKSNGAHGTVAITGGGTGLTYDPAGLYVGSDLFTYTVSDGHGGTDTATVLLSVVKDTQKPVATSPVQVFVNGTQPTGNTMTFRAAWGSSDTGGTGIASYKVQVSKNGGSYTTAISSTTGTSSTRTGAVNATYRYRVRATDKGGNVGAYVYGPTFKIVRYQDSSSAIAYAGSWKKSANTKASGGSHRYTGTAGATVRYTGTMRNVAWLATRTATSGSAQVWIDGTLAATINLRSSSTGYRKLVFHRDFGTLASHTIEIRSLGGGRVSFDALAVLR